MISDSCNTPTNDPLTETPRSANGSAQAPSATTTALPDPMSPPSDVPPRPSTAPPHPTSDLTIDTESQDLTRRTMLVSNLRARNLLLQKAISHIDDAVLHLMAARSGIPSSKIQHVRGEARNRKDLLDKVDKAIKMAQNGDLHEDGRGGDTGDGASSREKYHSMSAESGPESDALQTKNLSGRTMSPSSVQSLDAPQLRRSSSQPQLGPSTAQSQVPTKIYTLPELVERRKILQGSIDSWQKFAADLRATQPGLEQSPPPPPDAVSTESSATSSQDPSSWTPQAKFQRAQFEIKRREDLLVRLNQAIAQVSHPALSHTTPEQFAVLASYIPPALDKTRFDAAYAHFCHGKSIKLNTTIIMPDVSRPVIDVYSLHVAVMQEGSYARVLARKSWDVVGARLGFIKTAATATEPAKSSPEVAAHLEKAYRDRLQQFDHLYVSSVIETVRKRMAEQQKKS